jgi:hypothetical protein
MFLAFFSFNRINNLSVFSFALSSIPTAPTNHLPDGLGLNENTWGQKGANKADDPVLCFFSAARVTAGFVGSDVR